MRSILGSALALLIAAPGAAQAGMPMKVKEKCAVGGERFTYTTTPSYTTWGARPDGKPYGSWTFPMELPVCPKNGLVMYREFSKGELARLPALLATPEFIDLRPAETPYYRAAWLAKALDPSSTDHAWLLLSASWEADADAVRKARYQSEFAAAAAAAPARPQEIGWFALQVRAANALRELGRFDDASVALDALPRDVVAPKSSADSDTINDAEANKLGWRTMVEQLERLVARRDASSEPLDAIPEDIASAYCVGGEDLPKRDDPYCGDAKLAEPIARLRKQIAEGGDP